MEVTLTHYDTKTLHCLLFDDNAYYKEIAFKSTPQFRTYKVDSEEARKDRTRKPQDGKKTHTGLAKFIHVCPATQLTADVTHDIAIFSKI